ncbi:rhombotin-1-like isoform X2 [Mya arenaria]|uniref:rhombotin-1-like isoform X2 n=1 Tax=Mya arenaria TaxID=6604 RepID=UPI0022E39E46|nr:rhombotin-1-like isoform X2 [Mya arenaria]
MGLVPALCSALNGSLPVTELCEVREESSLDDLGPSLTSSDLDPGCLDGSGLESGEEYLAGPECLETQRSVQALLDTERDEVEECLNCLPLDEDEAVVMQLPQQQEGGPGQGGGVGQKQQECSGCKKDIRDRHLLKALDQYWHEDCLKCSCCDCRLGEVGSTLFAKANLLLCRRDYLRLFGTTGYCSACSKMIPAFEMVMRAKNNVYHLECFACQMCNHRFCVGDRFFLCDNKILCEYDYEERMVFANMTYNYNALSQIKRQTNSLSDDLSSGYGSPSPGSL